MAKMCALTTIDNPFDPLDDYQNWFQFDETHGYHTSSYLARIAFTSDQLSDSENARAIESAIDEIISEDFEGIYKKVSREDTEVKY